MEMPCGVDELGLVFLSFSLSTPTSISVKFDPCKIIHISSTTSGSIDLDQFSNPSR